MARTQVDLLLEEYKSLRSTLGQNISTAYRGMPLMITIGGALVLYDSTNPAFVGFGVAFGMGLVACWYGFCYSFQTAISLRLIEIELRLNRALRLRAEEGLRWHNLLTGAGLTFIPGHRTHWTLISMIGILVLIAALWRAWSGASGSCPVAVSVVLTALPIAVLLVASGTVLRVEAHARREKARLNDKFANSPELEGSSETVEDGSI